MPRVISIIVATVFAGSIAFAAEYDGGSTIPTAKETPDAGNPPPAAKTGLQKVTIAYKTHFDIGYTSTAHDVIHEYRTEMADRLLNAIDANINQPKEKQFVWTLSGYPMQQILWDGQSPERRAKIEQGIRDGNVAIHALPYTIHTETAEPEDLVRGLGISSALARKYGQPLSISGKSTDVPGQSWILPTLMAHAGIRFFHMGGPLVNLPFNLPPVFWWEGPDGSRVLTFYNNDYGIPAMPPSGWPYKTWLHLSMTGDNQGPPSPDAVQSSLNFYKSRGIDAQVGTMDDFYNEISKEDLSKLPVIRADLPCPWIHGVASMPAAVKVAQNSRPLIGALDQLNTLEKCWDIFRPEMSDTIRTAYQRTLRFSEHTFGMANQHYVKLPWGKDWDQLRAEGLPLQYQLMQESWKEKADCADDAARLIDEPYKDAVLSLADSINSPGGRIVVYNPLPWKRDAKVQLNCFHLPDGASAKPVDGGPAVPFACEPPPLEDKTRIRSFIAKDLPPMGYRTYVVSNEPAGPSGLAIDEKAATIENSFFKATFDAKRGRIASLIDKRSGRELVDPNAPQGFGQYLYERFGWQDLENWLNKSPYAYVHLYNNHWRTNFAAWIGDGARMTSTVRLWSFDKYNTESCLYTPAMETRVPAAAARSVSHPGKLPPTQPGITLSRKGVAVTAFGPNPDGPGTVLRVWEQAGASGDLTASIPGAFKEAVPVNLRGERAGASVALTGGNLTFPLKANAPASFVLR